MSNNKLKESLIVSNCELFTNEKKDMRKFILSERQIPCPSCDGEGTQNCMGYADCIDCDGEGIIFDEFWQGDYVKYRKQDLEGWVVGFTGNDVIVAVVDDEEDEEIQFTFKAEELEHGE